MLRVRSAQRYEWSNIYSASNGYLAEIWDTKERINGCVVEISAVWCQSGISRNQGLSDVPGGSRRDSLSTKQKPSRANFCGTNDVRRNRKGSPKACAESSYIHVIEQLIIYVANNTTMDDSIEWPS